MKIVPQRGSTLSAHSSPRPPKYSFAWIFGPVVNLINVEQRQVVLWFPPSDQANRLGRSVVVGIVSCYSSEDRRRTLRANIFGLPKDWMRRPGRPRPGFISLRKTLHHSTSASLRHLDVRRTDHRGGHL